MSDNAQEIANLLTPGPNTGPGTNLGALIGGAGAALDLVDPSVSGLSSQFSVTAAAGVALDRNGADWGVLRRPSESDSTYRARIKAVLPAFSRGPTPSALAAAVEPFTGVAPVISQRGVDQNLGFPLTFPLTFGAGSADELFTVDVYLQNPNHVAYQQVDVITAVHAIKRVTTTVVLWWDTGGSTTVAN